MLIELAERCEKATGPDRELDLAIGSSLGVDTHYLEHWTASLDAAMTLVPEGVRTLLNIAEDAITTAIVDGTQGCADTPALALCAAALRARAGEPKC